jgi:cell division protease FtsH
MSKKKPISKKSSKSRSKKPSVKPNGLSGNIFFYVFVLLGIYLVISAFTNVRLSEDTRPITAVIKLAAEGRVQDVIVDKDNLEVILQDGTRFYSKKESDTSFNQILSDNDIDISLLGGDIYVKEKLTLEQVVTPVLTFAFPLLLVFFVFRQMRGAGNDIMAFGKSRAKMFNKDKPEITFGSVAGCEEAKRELMEIVDFLKHPEKYRKLGARIPKGILLVGPSGVGKTLLAKAVAGEAKVPFFSVAGSEFMEMLVGVGSARARDLFKMAKEQQPSLIFIDEIDAIGRQRGMGIGGGHDEREQTLNQILIEMDGFAPRTDVIVIAATNRPDMLDPALIRPGRFDRRVTIPLPDLNDREAIIKIHMRGKPFDSSVDVEKLAKRTVSFSGADIENMLNESAILAARENKSSISSADLEEAALKVTLGSERRTLQTEEERKVLAYHEAGHALVASNMPDMDPVHRITIIARGGSLGHTSFPPERDRYNETQTRLVSMIATALGGRAAEDVVFGELTVGAANDIDRATELARKMVTSFGMSVLGPVSYDSEGKRIWLAREMSEAPLYSQEVAAKIDAEVSRIVEDAYKKAKVILTDKRKYLDAVASLLLEKETLTSEEYEGLLKTPQE